ncbi:MAG: replication/maintenance protein RepL [Clostridia bacterium]|nr:replication/maintenance protein RepL [Clostridia bacterium]
MNYIQNIKIVPQLQVENTDTGEVLGAIAITKTQKIEDFIIVFLKSLPILSDLDGNSMKVMQACWILSSFNSKQNCEGNVIDNNPAFKDSVRKLGYDVSDGCINNSISKLCKKEALIKRCRGSYMLNPTYFFKGTLTDRSKLQSLLTYEPQQ